MALTERLLCPILMNRTMPGQPGLNKGETSMHQVLNEKIPYFSDDGLSCAESSLRYLIEHGYADLPLDTVRIMTAAP